MTNSSKQTSVLTPDLMDYAQAVARKVALRRVPRFLGVDDAVQHAVIRLIQYPPQFDPSRKASLKTLIYAIIECGVKDFVKDHYKKRHEELPEPDQVPERAITRRTAARNFVDEMVPLIKDKEERALCLLVLECDGNVSKAARRLGLCEGTVRHRLKMLAPKLKKMGLSPF